MDSHTGWFKTFREDLSDDILNNPEVCALLMRLMRAANYYETTIKWEGKPRSLLPGQIVTSIRKLEAQTGFNFHKIKRQLDYLEAIRRLTQEKSKHGTIITICRLYEAQKIDEISADESATQTEHKMRHRPNTDRTQNATQTETQTETQKIYLSSENYESKNKQGKIFETQNATQTEHKMRHRPNTDRTQNATQTELHKEEELKRIKIRNSNPEGNTRASARPLGIVSSLAQSVSTGKKSAELISKEKALQRRALALASEVIGPLMQRMDHEAAARELSAECWSLIMETHKSWYNLCAMAPKAWDDNMGMAFGERLAKTFEAVLWTRDCESEHQTSTVKKMESV